MKIRHSVLVPVQALFVLLGSVVPVSSAEQTVHGPEYRLTKFDVTSVQRDERQCSYFLWTKLGGDAQRISFSYQTTDGKSDGDTPRIENVTIIINHGSDIPKAKITGVADKKQPMWQLEMSERTYDANRKCLADISVSENASR
jgi:hypothetical protein